MCEQLCRTQYRRLRHFDPSGPASFRTWLAPVVRNLNLDWRRRKYGRERTTATVSRLPGMGQELLNAFRHGEVSTEDSPDASSASQPDGSAEASEDSNEGRPAGAALPRFRRRTSPRISTELEYAAADGVSAEQIPDGKPDPEAQVVSSELLSLLGKAVARLDGLSRLMVHLRYEEGLTLGQVARIAGLPDAQTADRRIRTILAGLRKEIG